MAKINAKKESVRTKKEKKRRKFIFWWWFGGIATTSLLVSTLFTTSFTRFTPLNSSIGNQSNSTISENKEVASLSIERLPYKLEYTNLEAFNLTGGLVRVNYSGGLFEIIEMNDSMLNYSNIDLSAVGSKDLKLTIGDESISFKVNVTDYRNKIEQITLINLPSKITIGDSGKLEFNVQPFNAFLSDIIFESSDIDVLEIDELGNYITKKDGLITITITAGDYTTSFEVLVDKKSNVSVSLLNEKIIKIEEEYNLINKNLLTSDGLENLISLFDKLLSDLYNAYTIGEVEALENDFYNYIKPIIQNQETQNVDINQDQSASIPDPNSPTVSPNSTITVSNLNANSLTIAWNLANDDITPQSNLKYFIYQTTNASATYQQSTLLNINGTNNISTYNITGLNPSTTYYFFVVVADEDNNRFVYTKLTTQTTAATPGDTTIPTVTSATVTVSSITSSTLTLSWNLASDNVTSQENIKYFIYQTTNAFATYQQSTLLNENGTLNIITFNVSSLTENTQYYFYVVAQDEAGNNLVYTKVSTQTSQGPIYISSIMDLDMIDGKIDSSYWNGTAYVKPSNPTSYTFAAGTPYETTLNSLFASQITKRNFILLNDIDFKDLSAASESSYLESFNPNRVEKFQPIHDSTYSFQGIFDGNHKQLINLTIESSLINSGLFSKVDGGTIKDLSIIDGKLTSTHTAGGGTGYGLLVGRLTNLPGSLTAKGVVDNVFVTGSVSSTDQGTGGVFGYVNRSDVSNLVFIGSVTSTQTNAGGVSGFALNANFNKVYVNSTVTSVGSTGGLIGRVDNGSVYSEIYINTSVYVNRASQSGGGMFGFASDTSSDQVINSFVTGYVYGRQSIGGFAGELGTLKTNKTYSTAIVKPITSLGSEGLYHGGFAGRANTNYNFFNPYPAEYSYVLIDENYNTDLFKISGRTSASDQDRTDQLEAKSLTQLQDKTTFKTFDFYDSSANQNGLWDTNTNLNSGTPYLKWVESSVWNNAYLTYSSNVFLKDRTTDIVNGSAPNIKIKINNGKFDPSIALADLTFTGAPAGFEIIGISLNAEEDEITVNLTADPINFSTFVPNLLTFIIDQSKVIPDSGKSLLTNKVFALLISEN
jgi:hypothetical protein